MEIYKNTQICNTFWRFIRILKFVIHFPLSTRGLSWVWHKNYQIRCLKFRGAAVGILAMAGIQNFSLQERELEFYKKWEFEWLKYICISNTYFQYETMLHCMIFILNIILIRSCYWGMWSFTVDSSLSLLAAAPR